MIKRRFLFLPLLALVLTACAQPEIPQDRYYRLTLSEPMTMTRPFKGVVEVERFRADGLVSSRPIVYKDEGGHLAQYFYHFWVEPPVDLLQNVLVKYLRDADFADQVVTPDLRVDENYLITAQIKKMERDLRSNAIQLEIEMGFKRNLDDQIIVLKTYSRTLPQAAEGVSGAVDAINVAVGDIFAEFLTDAARF